MAAKNIRFKNAAGQRLSASIDLPDDRPPVAYALFAHCFTCSKNLKPVRHISRALNRSGIGVLRFDFTGLGESEGRFPDTNFTSNVADLLSAAAFLEAQYTSPAMLIGHSLGGAAALQAAAALPACRAVVTIAAPADPTHVRHLLKDHQDVIAAKGEAAVVLAGRTFHIKKQFLDDLEATRMADVIRDLNRALLILHSPVDDIVEIENAARIFKLARHPKSFISLDRADHLLLAPADAAYVGRVIAAWAGRYLEPQR